MASREELVSVARRVLRHADRQTTDRAAHVLEVPVGDYVDPDVWRTEVDAVFRTVPLALGLGAEVPGPGDYRALDVAGTPVLTVRGADGVVRSFLNVCRHRGARLCAPGTGSRRRFVCPYHAWTYDDRGVLVGVFRADQFGDVDRTVRGLVELPTEERHGIVWVVLDPDGVLDLDGWLEGFSGELAALGLADRTLHDRVELPGANWKLVFDGFCEAYHGSVLHADTLGGGSLPNLALVDGYGPHQRMVFAESSVLELAGRPEEEWDPAAHCVPNHLVFPNVSIAGGWHDLCMVCVVLPGPTVGTSVTHQTVLSRTPLTSRAERAVARRFSGLMLRVARDEDYPTVEAVQQGIGSGANSHFLLGRNEVAVQHLHQSLRERTGRRPLGRPGPDGRAS